MNEAQETAERLKPMITALDEAEDSPVLFDDYLAYYISGAGSETKHKTAHNMVDYGTKYVFWLGYLFGSGQAEGGKET